MLSARRLAACQASLASPNGALAFRNAAVPSARLPAAATVLCRRGAVLAHSEQNRWTGPQSVNLRWSAAPTRPSTSTSTAWPRPPSSRSPALPLRELAQLLWPSFDSLGPNQQFTVQVAILTTAAINVAIIAAWTMQRCILAWCQQLRARAQAQAKARVQAQAQAQPTDAVGHATAAAGAAGAARQQELEHTANDTAMQTTALTAELATAHAQIADLQESNAAMQMELEQAYAKIAELQRKQRLQGEGPARDEGAA